MNSSRFKVVVVDKTSTCNCPSVVLYGGALLIFNELHLPPLGLKSSFQLMVFYIFWPSVCELYFFAVISLSTTFSVFQQILILGIRPKSHIWQTSGTCQFQKQEV